MAAPKIRIAVFAALAVIACLYIVVAAGNFVLMQRMRATNTSPILSATHELPQADFARFWYTGRLLRRQAAANFGHQNAPDPFLQNTLRLDLLSPAAPPATAWLYPPPAGLPAMLFSYLPLAASFWAWRLASLLIAGWALRRAGCGWKIIAAGLASPAAWHDTLAGQTGTLTGGILVAALLLADTSPCLSGIFAGLLCIKPQMAFALPAAFLHRRLWRIILYALLTTTALILLATAIEGLQSWVWFFTIAQPAAAKVLAMPFHFPLFQAGFTVFIAARSLHAGLAFAWCAQAASSTVALGLTWHIWRHRTENPTARMAVTLSLSLLIAPYGFAYDLVGFSIAMAALAAQSSLALLPLPALLWLLPGYLIFITGRTGVIIMPLAAIIGALTAWRQLRLSNAANSPT